MFRRDGQMVVIGGSYSRRKEVEALGEMLGEEHDLAVLEATLAAEPASFGEASAELVTALSRRRREQLRAALRPKALSRRFEAHGQAAQDPAGHGGTRAAA